MRRASVSYPAAMLAATVVFLLTGTAAQSAQRYLGSKACAECHAEQYANFSKYAKKAHSSNSVKIMAPKLTAEEIKGCYSCHATGYGQPGGFVSPEKTPHLADAGCEVCHGPGGEHADSGGDASQIKRKMTMKDCETCHNAERVKNFNFKPLLYGGAH